ncbi:hypothetical protein CSV63_03560 [Sporosarcina sp. P34]|uniref:hypothetical protein n=1 Tax=Sporosarcina sp. P34 TaxID=2048247 RepID=UPI000C16B84C|nr:hypothetical protein [Sporosarcina sp. P34]PID16978.1 hypothetical protein CSV63_03560 [Sporosarcina sp. P34]
MQMIHEPFLQFHPHTAAQIGLNESMFLQQIHELSFGPHDTVEGTQWVRRSYKEWHNVMSFWSMATIIRAIRKLEKSGYIRSMRQNFGEKMYLVDYEICESNAIFLLQPVREELLNVN